MSEIRIVLEKERFRGLRGADINALLRERLPKVEETLQAELEEVLLKRLKKLEEKLDGIEEEIAELREFYEKALADKELLRAECDRLRAENEEFRRKVAEKRGKLENVHGS